MTGRVLPDLSNVVDLRQYKPRGSVTVADVKACIDAGMTKGRAAKHLGCSLQTITNRSIEGDLAWPRGRRTIGDGPTLLSRHAAHDAVSKASRGMPAVTNPAFTEGRTIYPSMVVDAGDVDRVLVSGHNSWKIGSVVTKGAWKGFPIFTLTLHERATCPWSCVHWRSCFGNASRFARRISAGPELEAALAEELLDLQWRHPRGFAVRLHVLGDFYSVAYVELWRFFLDRFPALHVFGFTARWEAETDPIARALVELVLERWDRFAIRFSNAPVDECSTVSIEHPVQKPADAVVCPQQTGRTQSCATCGFCWHSRRRVAFLRH